MSTPAYPLTWPAGRSRTVWHRREPARFETTFARARDNVIHEVQLLCGGRYAKPNLVISTNIALRRDGLPLANQREPDNPGVAIYFTYQNKQRCFACDRWKKVTDNMQAIAKTIEALRGIARWGTGDMLAAAFDGFTALPPPPPEQSGPRHWSVVLGVAAHASTEDVRAAYRRLAAANHPDRSGDGARMAEINQAWAACCKERGL